MSDGTDPTIASPIKPTAPRRRGFLPIETNAFDRVFIGVVLLVAIHLLWLRLAEPHGLSLYLATVISVGLGAFIVARG